jgi:hypothetical protein
MRVHWQPQGSCLAPRVLCKIAQEEAAAATSKLQAEVTALLAKVEAGSAALAASEAKGLQLTVRCANYCLAVATCGVGVM